MNGKDMSFQDTTVRLESRRGGIEGQTVGLSNSLSKDNPVQGWTDTRTSFPPDASLRARQSTCDVGDHQKGPKSDTLGQGILRIRTDRCLGIAA